MDMDVAMTIARGLGLEIGMGLTLTLRKVCTNSYTYFNVGLPHGDTMSKIKLAFTTKRLK